MKRTLRPKLDVLMQALEPRRLLSVTPSGSEFLVNTFTTGNQNTPAMAMDGDGDFVIVWQSFGQDGSGNGIYAQRYNASGVPQGSEFRVNTYTTNDQTDPAVAMDADGDFVIAWSSYGQFGPSWTIHAQRYNAVGVPQGGEFRAGLILYPTHQQHPSVGMDAAGNFVIAWQILEAGSGYGVYARRFDAAGSARGVEFAVNSYTTNDQSFPSVAMDDTGDFVIAWQSRLQDGDNYGIYGRRYNAAGVPQGGEFPVNTYTTQRQANPSAAMDADGDFLITWNSYGQDGAGLFDDGIYAQHYSASGAAQGSEFRVNTYTTSAQSAPVVARNAAGGFVIAWQSRGQDGSTNGIYAKQYNAAGQELVGPTGAPVGLGNEFRVNATTLGGQFEPTLAVGPDGDFVIAWTSEAQDGSGHGVYTQRYDESTDTVGPIIASVFVKQNHVLPYSVHRPTLQQIVVSFSENMSDAGGPTGANSVTNPSNWRLTRNGIDISSQISSINYGFNFAANRYEATLNLSTAHESGNFLLTAKDDLRDIAGNRLDGNFDGQPQGNFLLPFSITASAARISQEWQVNASTTSDQFAPAVATDANGNSVVVWTNRAFNAGQNGDDVYARLWPANGTPVGTEFRINTFTTGFQHLPAVAMDPDGDFVVVWVSDNQATPTSVQDIYAQRYNSAGVAQGAEFLVNHLTTGSQIFPSVAMNAAGGFVVTWVSSVDGSSSIQNRRFSASGTPQGGQFQVNTLTTFPSSPAVAMDDAGNTVITWQTQDETGHGLEIYAQRYNSAGLGQGTNFRVNANTIGHQTEPAVAMDADGDFVIAWTSRYQDGSYDGIYAQRYNAAGVAQGPEFRANTYTPADQRFVAVDMDADGNFVIAWESEAQDGDGRGIYMQQFAASGATVGGEVLVNEYTIDNQELPAVAMTPSGDFTVVWESQEQDGSGESVHLTRYGLDHPPSVGALNDNPDPVSSGNSFTLAASAVSDDGVVTSVSFYRETNGEPGLQVGAFGDTLVGTATTSAGGVWSISVSTASLGNGTSTYWAQAMDNAGLTGAPASTTNTVINAAPMVTSSQFFFDTLAQRLTFTFNDNVGASLDLGDIVIQQLPAGPIITPSGLSYNAATNTATVTFAGVLPDANFRATLLAAGITNSSGTPMAANHVFDFFFLRGDANHDGVVNLADFNRLAANFGQTNRTFSQGDFNYDGVVNLADFNILAGRFGQALGPDSFIERRAEFGTIPIHPSAKLHDRDLAALLTQFV